MLYGPNGKPITIEPPKHCGRRGMQADAFALPDGAVVSLERSMDLQQRIRNDARLRERIEAADRMTGTKTLHLMMLDHGEISEKKQDALVKNLEFAEKIMRKRIENEKSDLKGSNKAYEDISNN